MATNDLFAQAVLLASSRSETRTAYETVLHQALRNAGFNLMQHSVAGCASAKVDLIVTANLKGAATSLVDATYIEYSVEYPQHIVEKLGWNIRLVTFDLVDDLPEQYPGAPKRLEFRGVILDRGISSDPDIQTTYLAMHGIFPDLPMFSVLSDDQKTMVKNHITMLADFLRK